MITSARFKNYKLLRDVTLDLGRLNVIVGRNGIGKSSVLEGMDLIAEMNFRRPRERSIGTGRAGRVFVDNYAPDRLMSKPDARTLELEVVGGQHGSFGVRATIGADLADDEGEYEDEDHDVAFDLWLQDGQGEADLRVPGTPHADQTAFFARLHAMKLSDVLRLKLSAEAISQAHYSAEETPDVKANGEGLASVLQYLHGLNDGTSEAIIEDLRGIVPGVKKLRYLPARVRRTEWVPGDVGKEEREVVFMGTRVELQLDGVGWIPADALSEGTLLALGLVTMLRFKPPSLLLLDDIDKGLHPMAQVEVVHTVKKILAARPHLQIIATSHSPFVLDALQPDEVFIAGARSPTESRVRRLDSHPGWARRRDYMHPGEFWSLVGEGWVAEDPT